MVDGTAALITRQMPETGARGRGTAGNDPTGTPSIFYLGHKKALSVVISFPSHQVNTASGIKSRRADLKVVTPEAFILADEEYHIDRGSSLSLVCIIEKATAPPQ